MTTAERQSYFDGNRLVGWVRFAGFDETRAEGQLLIDGCDDDVAELDLGGLTDVNSLAASAMVSWYRHAFHQGKVVRFSNVPPDLRKIIAVSGLVELLFGDE